MKTLYKKDSKGRIRQWSIRVDTIIDNVYGIFTSDGLQGGKIKDEIFKEAKPNNQRKTSKAQAEFMMEADITKKLRSNYFETVEDIKEDEILFMPTGCPSGMVWEEWKDKKHIVYPALASAKLDSSKMYSTWRDGRVFLNTRSAKEHMNFRHIEEALEEFYKAYPNIVLDGEAYNHEYADRFEDLQSIFRKQNPTDSQREASKEVAKFYVYDIVDLNNLDLTASERQDLLYSIFNGYSNAHDCLVTWGSYTVKTELEYDQFHEKSMDDGFEGSVLKISDQPYVQRKNKNVMKRKPKFDCEFLIMNVIEGEGTNKGIAAKVVIGLATHYGMNAGHIDVLATVTQEAGMAKGWNHDMLREMLKNKADYIGKMATIEYGGITAYGKLRFPKFKAIRTD